MEFFVTSLNIDCLSMNRKEKYRWEHRKNNLKDYLSHSVSDIFSFQEACDINIDYINMYRDDMLCYKGYGIKNSEGIITYNPIYWNTESFIKLKSGSFFLSEATDSTRNSGWDSSELRSVTWIVLKNVYDKSRIIILNTHLDNKGVVARLESAKLLSEFALKLSRQECCPTIITGDFNSRPWYPLYENQNTYGDLIWPGYLPTDSCHRIFEENGICDCFYLGGKKDSLDSNTYHDYYGILFPNVALRIDWQLLWNQDFPNIKLLSYDVERDYIVSDHFPVVCKYTIEPTTYDCLFSGYNKVFTYCSQGYALKTIGDYLDRKFPKKYIQRAVLEGNYLQYTLKEQKEGFDFPSNNAVFQMGIIKEMNCSGKTFIIKSNNPLKRKLCREIDNYKKLKCLFPGSYSMGMIDKKEVFFDIIAPINLNKFDEDGYSLMHKLEGDSLDSLIYSYDTIDIRLLEFFVKIIYILFQHGFVCADISPRNVIVYQTPYEIHYRLIDFEKSYFLSIEELEDKKDQLMRGQFCGEELAVLLDIETIKKLFGNDYNPDYWDCFDTHILYKPFRPEIHDILAGRNMIPYSVGTYNTVEKEVLDVVKPNRNAKYEVLRYPGRIKFKVEHYFNCLAIGDGGDYERKITELLIRSRKQSYYSYCCLAKYLADYVGFVEEQILIEYSTNGNITNAKQKGIELRDIIDKAYWSNEEFIDIIRGLRC